MSGLIKKVISTLKAPGALPGAPYSQAIVYNDTVFLSGMLGVSKETNKLVEGGTGAQAKKALENIGIILEAAGSSYENALKTTIFLKDLNDYAVVNNVYKQYFTDPFPARSCLQVAKLPLNAAVEIEVIAALGNVKIVQSKL